MIRPAMMFKFRMSTPILTAFAPRSTASDFTTIPPLDYTKVADRVTIREFRQPQTHRVYRIRKPPSEQSGPDKYRGHSEMGSRDHGMVEFGVQIPMAPLFR
jgi:hypothetical protein